MLQFTKLYNILHMITRSSTPCKKTKTTEMHVHKQRANIVSIVCRHLLWNEYRKCSNIIIPPAAWQMPVVTAKCETFNYTNVPFAMPPKYDLCKYHCNGRGGHFYLWSFDSTMYASKHLCHIKYLHEMQSCACHLCYDRLEWTKSVHSPPSIFSFLIY